MARPGVMFYFEIRPCIRRLSLADKGQLFEAILDYAENGIEPELDGALGVAWDFIQPRIDLDSEQYELKVETSQYAAFSRERKKLGLEPIDRDAWRSMTDIERHLAISSDESDAHETSGDIGRYPNPNTNTKSNILSRSSAKPSRLSDEDFEAFWKEYPRKESKAQARKSFAKVNVSIDELLQALETQKQSDQWRRDGGQYIPYASTWLNQRRWEDEVPTQAAKAEEPADNWQRDHPDWIDQSTWILDADGVCKPPSACTGACV